MQPVPSTVLNLQTSDQDFLINSLKDNELLLDPQSEQSPVMSPVSTPGGTLASSQVGSPTPDPFYMPRRSTRQHA